MLAYRPGLLATVPSPHGRLRAFGVLRLSDDAAHPRAKRRLAALVLVRLRVRCGCLEVRARLTVILSAALRCEARALFGRQLLATPNSQ